MVEALFRQDEPDADDVAGRRLPSVMHYLDAIKETGTDEPLKVAAKMRRSRGDFFSQRQAARGQSDGA
jgi:hypothetical protein